MSDYSITISRVGNGYVIADNTGGAGSVFEDVDKHLFANDKCADSALAMLYGVIEFFGLTGSKHDPFGLRVIIVDQNNKEVEL